MVSTHPVTRDKKQSSIFTLLEASLVTLFRNQKGCRLLLIYEAQGSSNSPNELHPESFPCQPSPSFQFLGRNKLNFVIVPADKASNKYTFVCKRYYVDILIEELGLHLLPGNPTYNLTDFSASEVLDNHKSVLTSFGIQTTDEELDLPYIYWIPKMHKNPYKHRFIAGSSKCSTKPISILLTKLLTHIKQGLQKYCETSYSRSGINQMWIQKNY